MTEARAAPTSRGIEPEDLADEEKAVYSTTLKLSQSKGHWSKGVWKKAGAILRKARCA